MSFGIPSGEGRDESVPPTTFDFGPGFSTIDIATVVKSSTAITSASIALTTSSASIQTTGTTLARITRIQPSSSSPTHTSTMSTISKAKEVAVPSADPSETTPSPNFPTVVVGTNPISPSEITDSTSSHSSSETLPPSPSQATEATPRSNLSPGAAAGIGLIVAVVLILLGFGVFRYLRQKKNQGLPPPSSKKSGKDKTAQMATMPYLGNERGLEEGWESGSTIAPFTFEELDRAGLGIGVESGAQSARGSNASLTRLPIYR
ncbi:hypothetical protein TWF481_008351 [Arthrobotrys musiformis]|uniref:Mid2 domain-containing protein n=1 Tax=Arthrobotrys musiformis TaxID=47236 RepID=A0AAV9W6V4_9PEZI